MAHGDFDGDGYEEVVVAGYSAGKLYAYTYAPWLTDSSDVCNWSQVCFLIYPFGYNKDPWNASFLSFHHLSTISHTEWYNVQYNIYVPYDPTKGYRGMRLDYCV